MTGTKIRLRRNVYDSLLAERNVQSVAEQVRLTGVPRKTLYRIRSGSEPSLATAMQISEALNVPLTVLFERTEDAA